MDEQHLPASNGHDESPPPNLGRHVKFTHRTTRASLRRRPTLDNGVGMMPRKRRAMASAAGNGDGDASNDKVTPDDFAGNGESLGITIMLRYRGRTRTMPLVLDHATLVQMVLESQLRDIALGELIADLLQQAIKPPPA